MVFTKVYSGIRRRCMCGCSGKYSYTLAGALAESDTISLPVNERSVAIISNKILKDPAHGVETNHIWVEKGNRILVAWFK